MEWPDKEYITYLLYHVIHYSTRYLASYFTYIIFCDCGQHSTHLFQLPVSWGLHVSVSVVQLILCFYTPYLKKMLGRVSFVLQKYVASNKHVVDSMVKFCRGNWRLQPDCLPSNHLQCKDYFYTFYPLMCPVSKYHTGSDPVDNGPQLPAYHSVTKNIL
jgi:hypothetical protein